MLFLIVSPELAVCITIAAVPELTGPFSVNPSTVTLFAEIVTSGPSPPLMTDSLPRAVRASWPACAPRRVSVRAMVTFSVYDPGATLIVAHAGVLTAAWMVG